jgi:hypothetical protein
MIPGNEWWKACGKKWSWSILKNLPTFFWRDGGNHENFGRGSLYPCRVSATGLKMVLLILYQLQERGCVIVGPWRRPLRHHYRVAVFYIKHFRYSYAGGEFKYVYTYAGHTFHKVAYTKYDVTSTVQRMDFKNFASARNGIWYFPLVNAKFWDIM